MFYHPKLEDQYVHMIARLRVSFTSLLVIMRETQRATREERERERERERKREREREKRNRRGGGGVPWRNEKKAHYFHKQVSNNAIHLSLCS